MFVFQIDTNRSDPVVWDAVGHITQCNVDTVIPNQQAMDAASPTSAVPAGEDVPRIGTEQQYRHELASIFCAATVSIGGGGVAQGVQVWA